MIRVLIADDHAAFRKLLLQTFSGEPDVEIVGQATNGEEVIEQAVALQPDIVLMDIDMPRLDGVQATVSIRRQVPKAKVIAVTAMDDERYIIRLVQAGAVACVVKDNSPQEILEAVRAAYAGYK